MVPRFPLSHSLTYGVYVENAPIALVMPDAKQSKREYAVFRELRSNKARERIAFRTTRGAGKNGTKRSNQMVQMIVRIFTDSESRTGFFGFLNRHGMGFRPCVDMPRDAFGNRYTVNRAGKPVSPAGENLRWQDISFRPDGSQFTGKMAMGAWPEYWLVWGLAHNVDALELQDYIRNVENVTVDVRVMSGSGAGEVPRRKPVQLPPTTIPPSDIVSRCLLAKTEKREASNGTSEGYTVLKPNPNGPEPKPYHKRNRIR